MADQAVGVAIAEAMALNGLNRETRKKRHDDAAKQSRRQAIAACGPDTEQKQRQKQQMLPRHHTEQIGDHVEEHIDGGTENARHAPEIDGAARTERKSTRLNTRHK